MTVPVNGPAVILVDPQLGENIGMTARAMLNCGLTDLRLVRSRDGWPNPKAIEASSGADAVVAGARLFDTTQEAVMDLTRVYATTGRVREMVGRILTPRAAAAEIRDLEASGRHRVGILFGGERSGLANDDVSLADTIVRVPLNPDFKSLNLSQAVLLIAYEWFAAGGDTPGEALRIGDAEPATKAQLDVFIDKLETGIDAGGFFRSPNMRPTVMRNIRNTFQRANLTDQEVRTLHGIVEALKKGATQGKTE